MMSMAGGWFFLTVTEAFQLGDKDFRLPGLGSYMSVASDKGDNWAKFYGVVAMITMIVVLDQFLWRPLVVWGQKFRVEEGGAEENMHSWFLDFLNQSQILHFIGNLFTPKPRLTPAGTSMTMPPADVHLIKPEAPKWHLKIISILCFIALVSAMAFGAWKIVQLFSQLTLDKWILIIKEAGTTLGRVLTAVFLSAIWTIPVGLYIGLRPRLSAYAQPLAQIAASVPATALFPIILLLLIRLGGGLGVGSIVLLLLGTQWYILFNVIAGASAIPTDLREVCGVFRLGNVERWRTLLLPGIFPYLITGFVTASGGAWNASIVAEYFHFRKQTFATTGLGALISQATDSGNSRLLLAATIFLAAMVVTINRLVWRRLYYLASTRFKLE